MIDGHCGDNHVIWLYPSGEMCLTVVFSSPPVLHQAVCDSYSTASAEHRNLSMDRPFQRPAFTAQGSSTIAAYLQADHVPVSVQYKIMSFSAVTYRRRCGHPVGRQHPASLAATFR